MAQNNLPIILKEHYSDGQLLGLDDFVTEQDFHIQHRELLTSLCYTPGVLNGFAVQAVSGQLQVQVDPGVAIDSQGHQIVLVDIARLGTQEFATQAGKVVIDVSDPQYTRTGSKSWVLSVAFNEEAVPQQTNQMKQVPLFALLDPGTISPGQNSASTVPLALLNFTVSQTTVTTKDASGKPVEKTVTTVTLQVDSSPRVNAALASPLVPSLSADKITGQLQANQILNLSADKITGQLQADQIPKLDSDKIDWSTVKADQLPNLSADQITGQLKADQIPNLNADQITGPLKAEQIPELSSDKIDWSTVKADQLPNLGADKITGQLKADQVPKLNADKITGQFQADQIPLLGSDKIDWSTVKADQLPKLSADQITGQLQANQIPNLSSDKIDWSTVKADQLPKLSADQITGQFQAGQIPNLSADKIQSGVLNIDRLPPIPASQITGLPGSDLQTLWAQDVAIFAQGVKLVGRPQSGSQDGFIIGLLKTQTDKGQTYYGLGIGFSGKLLSFTSAQITGSPLKMNVYPERTLYNLASEIGAPTETATSVQFVGVDPDYAFNLLAPESQLPVASQGKLRSLVTVGTSPIDTSDATPRGAIDIINTLESIISPFSFMALANRTPAPMATPEALAQQLYGEGLTAPEAAPILVAQQPGTFINHAERLLSLLTNQFKESTRTAAQTTWALAAAGIPPTQAVPALAKLYSLRDLAASEGVFPSPSVQQLIIQLQEQGKSAGEAAAQLKQADAQYNQNPLVLGILLRLNFNDTSTTPQAVAQALKSAGYTAKSSVQAALEQLFPKASAQAIASAVAQAYPA
jgi:hypothetical protein